MLNVIQPASDSTLTIIWTGVVAGIVAQRLETAKSLSASDLINSRDTPGLEKVLMGITNGEGLHGTIDTIGHSEIVKALLSSTGKEGNVVTVGVGDVCGLHLHTRWTPTDQCSSQPKSHIT